MKRNYLSASALKAFAKSANHYLEYIAQTYEPSPAMQLGTLIHCLLLEPYEFQRRYAIMPEVDRRTKAGKEEWLQFSAEHDHLELVKRETFDDASNCVAVATMDPILSSIMAEPNHVEEELEGELFGFPFKARIDLETEEYVYDVKTTQDASPEAFMRQAHNLDYHLQAAVYRLMTGKVFRWIAIETKAPYNVAVYQQSEIAFSRSSSRLKELVRDFVAWDGKPKSYSTEILTLDLPRWA